MTIKVSYNITTPTIRITYNNSSVFVKATSQSSSVYVKTSYGTGGGGAAVWGGITGTLSDQTDLQSALDGKYDDPTGTTAQYIRGDGSLATFPTIPDVSGFVPKTTNLTINGTTQDLSTDRTWNVGDMLKSVYDTDNSGIVDKAEKMTTICRNSTGATIYKGTIVYLSGSTGNRPNIVKAIATSDATSAQTFGVVIADIQNNTDGEVATIGTLDNLDTRSSATHPFTSDTLADGDILYLSPTTAGYVTNVKPFAPYHIVYCGMVVRTHPTLGTIVYRIQNGYELDELHNVSAQTPSNNDGLFYESSTSLWKNKSIGTVLGYTPVPSTRTLTINGTEYDLSANRSWTIFSIPSQTGNAGKYLTTDGTTASWATVTSGNIYTIDGTLTGNRTLTSGGYSLTFTGSNTASAALAKGIGFTYTLVAAANNDVLVGLDINPTFTNGSFTGVNNIGALVRNGKLVIKQSTSGFASGDLEILDGGRYSPIVIQNTSTSFRGYVVGTSNHFILGYGGASAPSPLANKSLLMSIGGSDILITQGSNSTPTASEVTMQLFGSTRNITIGGTTDAGYKLDVQGTGRIAGNTLIKGTTSLSTSNALQVENLAGNVLLSLRNDKNLVSFADSSITLASTTINTASSWAINLGQAYISGPNFLAGLNQYFASSDGSNVIRYMAGNGANGLKIEIGTTSTFDASALLQVNSTSKGILIPRMTTAQMYSISSPANGLEVYKTDGYQGNFVYMENEWRPIANGTEMIVFYGAQGSNQVLLPFTQSINGTGATVTSNVWTQAGANLLKSIPYAFSTGTTTTGAAGINTPTNAGLNITTVGAKFCLRYEMATPSVLSDATNTYILNLGITVGNATPVANNIGFYYSHGTNAGAWTCFWGALAGSSASSGVTVAVSTKYILEIEFTIGTSIKYYINGSLVLTQTTGIPTQLGANSTPFVSSYIWKTAGTTSITTYQGSILYKRLI